MGTSINSNAHFVSPVVEKCHISAEICPFTFLNGFRAFNTFSKRLYSSPLSTNRWLLLHYTVKHVIGIVPPRHVLTEFVLSSVEGLFLLRLCDHCDDSRRMYQGESNV